MPSQAEVMAVGGGGGLPGGLSGSVSRIYTYNIGLGGHRPPPTT